MRLITIGCEYAGKTTLADALKEWGPTQGRHFHMDDADFSIPDVRHLEDEEQRVMAALPARIKERFQRFQIYYHIGVISKFDDCILGGFHIEETVYGPRYYYPGRTVGYAREVETKLPSDTILVLLTADPDVIRERMKAGPHAYQLVQPDEIEDVQRQFEQEFGASWIKHKVRLDTSEFPPEEILDRFLDLVRPSLSMRDLILLGRRYRRRGRMSGEEGASAEPRS